MTASLPNTGHDPEPELRRIQETIGQSNTRVPSPEEHQLIFQEVNRIEQEIDDLDDEIARLHAIRWSKSASIHRLNHIIAPHKKLPAEILALIFQHTLSDSQDPTTPLFIPSMLRRRSSPWNLRQVCSSWRRIALTKNTLWNNLVVEWTEKDKLSSYPIPRWSCRLKVAGSILPAIGPIHLEFCCSREDSDDEGAAEDVINAALDFVENEARKYRVKSLGFRLMTPFESLLPFYTGGPLSLPNLKNFSLLSNWDNSNTNIDFDRLIKDPSLALFSKSPRIQVIKLFGDTLTIGQLLRFVEVSQITCNLTSLDLVYDCTEARLGRASWVLFTTALTNCLKLKSLTLQLHANISSPSISTQVTLPYLESLTLYAVEPVVFDTFILPSLSYLCYKAGTIFRTSELIGLLKRSKCSLKTFIEFTYLSDSVIPTIPVKREEWDELVSLLRSVKELRTITLLDKRDLERIGDAQILPQVERLNIHVDSVAVSEVFGILKNRFCRRGQPQSPSRIQSLDVMYKERTLFGDLEEKADLRVSEEDARAMGTQLKFRVTGRERFRKKLG